MCVNSQDKYQCKHKLGSTLRNVEKIQIFVVEKVESLWTLDSLLEGGYWVIYILVVYVKWGHGALFIPVGITYGDRKWALDSLRAKLVKIIWALDFYNDCWVDKCVLWIPWSVFWLVTLCALQTWYHVGALCALDSHVIC